MKATTKLQVPPNMRLTVTVEMTVEEADALIPKLNEWPGWHLANALRKSLELARRSYEAEHDYDPTK